MSETITRNINLGYSITGVSNPDKYHILFENVGNTNAAIYAQGTKVFDKSEIPNGTINGADLFGNNIFYGKSTSAASTVGKVVSIPSIKSLNTGQIIIVQPTITSTVADSTLKLNDFTAYPMRYNGSAITTSTDSIVWSKSYPSIWVFDGEYWVFAGHGVDSNTTYSAMSVAEIKAGTTSSSRTMTAANIKATFDITGSEESGYNLLIRGITGTAASKTQVNNLLNKLERGSKIFWGSSQPTTDVQDGDIFVNTDNDNVYARINNSWEYQYNIGGNMGPSGAKGVLGAQGSTGIIGAIGNQGVTGAQGAQGITGAGGAIGIQGNRGVQLEAVQGATGPQGLDQPTKQGAQGITGASVTSSQGNRGVQLEAVQGATGPQGSDQPTKQGAQGITGKNTASPQGNRGVQLEAVQGATGPQGLDQPTKQGAQGITGTKFTSPQGNRGVQLEAVQGATGQQGSDQPTKQGAQGITGASVTSPQGNRGIQLATVQGATGPQGSDQPTKQGAQGITGASKTSLQGNKGVQLGQATQGATGPQGSDQPTKQGAQGITINCSSRCNWSTR